MRQVYHLIYDCFKNNINHERPCRYLYVFEAKTNNLLLHFYFHITLVFRTVNIKLENTSDIIIVFVILFQFVSVCLAENGRRVDIRSVKGNCSPSQHVILSEIAVL